MVMARALLRFRLTQLNTSSALNKMNKKLTSLLLTGSLVLGVSPILASTVDITVADNDPTANWFGTDSRAFTGHEDNETEFGTINSQVWDMEAFVVSGSTLYIVGGYNMQAGEDGWKPGDLFIKVGGSNPTYNPLTVGETTISNSLYGYSYAVDLSQPVGATGSTASAYALANTSTLDTVNWGDRGANPWRYDSGGSLTANSAINYSSGHADGDAALVALGLGGLTGGSHNILSVDLSFLSVAAGTDVFFSYTMECGNDSLKGEYGGGFDRVPDATSSALLIGLGLATMSVVGLKRRKS
ncbi:MAG: hypothetical protein JWQ62_1353 [Lacunisphaera sp.]|nr:hypothetical protein [Lacunisphaera sp.]